MWCGVLDSQCQDIFPFRAATLALTVSRFLTSSDSLDTQCLQTTLLKFPPWGMCEHLALPRFSSGSKNKPKLHSTAARLGETIYLLSLFTDQGRGTSDSNTGDPRAAAPSTGMAFLRQCT